VPLTNYPTNNAPSHSLGCLCPLTSGYELGLAGTNDTAKHEAGSRATKDGNTYDTHSNIFTHLKKPQFP
jgi:hypothetical protein